MLGQDIEEGRSVETALIGFREEFSARPAFGRVVVIIMLQYSALSYMDRPKYMSDSMTDSAHASPGHTMA